MPVVGRLLDGRDVLCASVDFLLQDAVDGGDFRVGDAVAFTF